MRTLLFAVAIAASASACTVEDPDASDSSHHVEIHNRLAANRLAANRLAANRLAANRLAANSISSTRLSALEETASILQTKSGRQVYAYLMSCALDDLTEITKENVLDCVDSDDDGVPDEPLSCVPANDPEPTAEFDDPKFCTDGTCTFPGNLGLAKSWADRKLTGAGEGWVSACMFARINAHDTAEGISLRGSHANLTPSGAERVTYSLQEGAFYGNMFNKQGLDWNACVGADQFDWLTGGEPNDGVEDPSDNSGGSLYARDCTEDTGDGTTACGFNYAGQCSNACQSEDGVDGFFNGCHPSESGGKRYGQVITVWVAAP